ERLARAADSGGALRHVREGGDAEVLPAIHEVLIDLVRDRERAVLDAQLGDKLKLGSREDLAGRVVGRVDDDGSGLAAERAPQLVRVERPIRSTQRHIARNGAADDAVRSVVLIKGLE